MTAEQVFAFVQLEFPWALGPADGRYVARGHAGEAEQVVVLATLGARPRAGLLARRRRQAVEPSPPPEPVVTGRVTVIRAEPVAGDPSAWLAAADGEAEATAAVRVLNRILHAHRVASADPAVREIDREQAIVVRLGVGPGDRVADGRWSEAIELPPPPRSAAPTPCGPRSAWRPCSAAATRPWPARTSSCAPGPTSPPAACARPPSRPRSRCAPPPPSSSRGPRSATWAGGSTSSASCCRGSRRPRSPRSAAA